MQYSNFHNSSHNSVMNTTEQHLSTTATSDSTSHQQQKMILANWRHELRTPLNAIIGYSEMLLEDADERGLEELSPPLHTIRTTGKQLLAVVNSVLDVHKIETSQKPPDLRNLSSDLVRESRSLVQTILHTAKHLLLSVSDAKQGNFRSDLQKIDSAAEEFLKLLNDIVEYTAMVAEDAAPQWMLSRSSMLIEEARKVARASAQSASDMVAADALLLVVDDNEMNRDVLLRHLERQGYAVMVAENGRQALDMIHSEKFTLVLLDIVMPEMNGFQVLQQLKQEGLLHNLPVIMISALDEMESAIRCIEMGAEDFLPKPFDPILLHARIRSCLEKQRLRDLSVEYLQNLAWLAEEHNREQATFMRILVHELKSPVSAAKMMADLLSCYPLENPKIAHLPERIAVRMDELLQLIKDILKLAKVKSGDSLGEPVTLDLVHETQKGCEAYQSQAEDKGLTMTVACPEVPVYVRFDVQSYEMILSNFVSNAVKYTATGSVGVSLTIQGSWAVLDVRDSGIGIPEDELPNLFQEFFRASNAKKQKIQGSGVGLAGVKYLVERFGGQLSVQSRENEGSTFSVRLPLHQE